MVVARKSVDESDCLLTCPPNNLSLSKKPKSVRGLMKRRVLVYWEEISESIIDDYEDRVGTVGIRRECHGIAPQHWIRVRTDTVMCAAAMPEQLSIVTLVIVVSAVNSFSSFR